MVGACICVCVVASFPALSVWVELQCPFVVDMFVSVTLKVIVFGPGVENDILGF